MNKKQFSKRTPIRFKQFTNKRFALFNCLGREVLVGVLSVATLTHAKADGISTTGMTAEDSLTQREVRLEEVSVTGARAPMTEAQSAVLVQVISREEILKAHASTVNDVLKLATGVDVRQRSGFGLQTDISINGGTFDQIAVLLNGVNISNTQTGHNTAVFPVSLNDIERIEILEGASARVYGSGAFSGAINIVTRLKNNDHTYNKNNEAISGRVAAEGGSYGTLALDAAVEDHWKDRIHVMASGGYTRSDGGTLNSYFEKGRFFSSAGLFTEHFDLLYQFGMSTNRLGANTFYSARFNNQYEKIDNATVSVTMKLRNLPKDFNLETSCYYNVFNDHYQLTRYLTGADKGENWHNLDIKGMMLNASYKWLPGTTSVGADVRRERIYSTAYGQLQDNDYWKHIDGSERMYNHKGVRWNTSVFAEHNIILDKMTVSGGLLFNRVSYPRIKGCKIGELENNSISANTVLAPGIDISYRPSKAWKLFLSWNKAMLVPTYTDLFTSNAVQQGDPNLRAERNNMMKTGAQYSSSSLDVQCSMFYSHGTNMIDWVYPTEESTRYQAMNIGRLDNMGYSVDAKFDFSSFNIPTLDQLRVGYAYIYQHHETDKPIFRSLYALEYLRHKFTVQLDQKLWKNLSAHWSARWQQRMNGFHPYWKIDGKLQWTHRSSRSSQHSSMVSRPSYKVYVKADNITNHMYYDIAGVMQPGLWIMSGVTVEL